MLHRKGGPGNEVMDGGSSMYSSALPKTTLAQSPEGVTDKAYIVPSLPEDYISRHAVMTKLILAAQQWSTRRWGGIETTILRLVSQAFRLSYQFRSAIESN